MKRGGTVVSSERGREREGEGNEPIPGLGGLEDEDEVEKVDEADALFPSDRSSTFLSSLSHRSKRLTSV